MKKLLLVSLLICLPILHFNSCQTTQNDNQVVIIGVDGADWKVLNTLFAQGKLPNLKKMVDNGVSAPLETIEPILSPIIWTTIATGRAPHEHGITYFVQHDSRSGKPVPVTSLKRRTKALWNIVSEHNKTAGFIGWWASWPAETVNGFIISDHVATHGFGLTSAALDTDQGNTYPPELLKTISPLLVRPSTISNDELKTFMPLTDGELATRTGDKLDFTNPLHHFNFALASAKTYENIALWSLQKQPTDLMGVYFEMVDSISHLFMKYTNPPMAGLSPQLVSKFKDVVYRTYEYQDKIIGRLMKQAPHATYVILSDHGFKSGDRRLPELLQTDIGRAHLWHEKHGVLIMYGPNIKKGMKLENSSVYDITPTVLFAMGLKPAKDMRGTVLSEAFTDKFRAAQPLEFIASYENRSNTTTNNNGNTHSTSLADSKIGAAAIDDQTLQHLAALGYMEAIDDSTVDTNAISMALKAGDLTSAKENLDRALTKHSNEIKIQMLALEYYRMVKDIPAQTKTMRTVLDLACNNNQHKSNTNKTEKELQCQDVAFHVGALALSNNKTEIIRKALDLAKKEKQVKAQIYYLEGLWNEQNKNIPAAIKSYKAAIAQDGSHIFSLNNLAGCLAEKGKKQEARRYYEKAASIDPRHVESRFNLGILAFEEKDFQQAATYLRATLNLNPKLLQAFPPLIQAELKLNQLEKAQKNIELFSQVSNDPVLNLSLQARWFELSGNITQASTLFEQAKQLNPQYATTIKKSL